MTGSPEVLLFRFLEYLPLSGLTSIVALLSIALFFITSADSGIYVLNNIASRDKALHNPAWQTMMWGVLMSIIAMTLLASGGLGTLQTVTLITALPFAVLMLIMCGSLFLAFVADKKYFSSTFTTSSATWTGEKWRKRLDTILHQTSKKDIINFFDTTALPAMNELREELTEKYGLKAHINNLSQQDSPALEFIISHASVRDFKYGIRCVPKQIASELVNDSQLPHIQDSISFEPVTYFFDGRAGYEVHYMTHNEIISDILKHYERYLSLLNNVGQELMAHEITNLAE